MLAAVETAASVADFQNDVPTLHQLASELAFNIRRVDRILKWLSANFANDWTDENAG